MSLKTQHLYEFDGYLLNVGEKNLWRDDELVQMPPKVFETLCLLVEKRGEVVSKDEMLDRIWADSFVEESNLSQNIYTLRQILGKEKKYIETVPKKGYRFAVPVAFLETENVRIGEENGSQSLILATRTKTRLIEETIFEDTNVSAGGKFSFSRKALFAAALGVISAFVIVFLSYYFYQTEQPETSRNLLAGFELKSLTDTGDAFFPAISPDGKLVAYLKGGEEKVLHLKDIESGNDIELKINSDAKPDFLQFAPDGRQIFFRTQGTPQSPQKIYEISYFGGQPKLVAENVWGYFSFSPDGRKIAFYRRLFNETQVLVVKNLESGEETAVVERFFPQRFFLHIYPAWSPDGGKIAFVPLEKNPNRSDIIVLDLETQSEELLKTELLKIQQIAWLPDGKNLLAIAKEKEKGRQIWQLSYPGAEIARVTNDLHSYGGISMAADGRRIVTQKRRLSSNIAVLPEADLNKTKILTEGDYGHHGIFDLHWTAGGKIIYEKRGDIHRDLWLGDVSGAQIRLTANESSHNRRAAVSADGRFVYFESNRAGALNIWRVNSDGASPAQITFSANESHSLPALSPDDEWLYFISQDKYKKIIRRKSLKDGKTEAVFAPENFSLGNFLSVSPDGRHLAFRRLSGQNQNENASGINIGFLNLSDKKEVKFAEIDAGLGFIRWTNGGQTFDYAKNSTNGGQIWRQSFVNKYAPPELVFQLPNEKIYHFDWSPDGKDLAIARGRGQSDVVVLETGD